MYITKKSYAIFFPNSVSWRGLQPRIAPVCTGACAGSSSTRFRRRFRRFRRRSGIWCRDRSGSTGSGNPEKVPRSPGAKPSQVQQVQQGSGEGSGEGLGGARSGSTGFRRRFRRRSGRRQVKFNRVLEKVLEKLLGSLGAKPSQVQRVPEKVAEKVPEKVLGIFGAGPGQVPTGSRGFQRLVSQHASERFVKIKRCGCWGYHRSLF